MGQCRFKLNRARHHSHSTGNSESFYGFVIGVCRHKRYQVPTIEVREGKNHLLASVKRYEYASSRYIIVVDHCWAWLLCGFETT